MCVAVADYRGRLLSLAMLVYESESIGDCELCGMTKRKPLSWSFEVVYLQ